MNLKQKIINKAIETEKYKILRLFSKDATDALGHILSRCGVQFIRKQDTFEIQLNEQEDIIITVKKKTR